MRRSYHNVTCRYNVYWNGMNALNEGDQNLKESLITNYNDVLRVYDYGTKKEAQKLNPKMDRAIKKASIGIQKHSMYFGGEEKVNYVKESYMMMGKAHFYKHDFISARRVFDYVAKENEDDPISNEAYLWLAKTHIETERFEKAEATLNLLYSKTTNSYVQQSVRKDLPLVQADFYIALNNYNSAYGYLERGVELGNERDVITRVLFILGQINQLDGELDLATDYYDKVVKRNPDYIMAFEARMNMAQCYDEGTGDSKNINKVLNKMAKDFRNKEFLDQIYYALADIALKDNNVDLGIEYLRKSVSSSTRDNYQKSTSALRLAELYFDRAEYRPAEAYYDTAVTFLPTDYPDYDIIKNKANVLSDIVIYAQTIQLQDSLQYLASMDTNELLVMIDYIIEDYKLTQVQLEEERELAEEQGVQFVDVGNDRSSQRLGGKWYFYNSQAMSVGRGEFKKKWGDRKLEDNWRLTDKRLLLQSYGDQTTEVDENITNDTTVASAGISDPERREYYLADIPNTEADMEESRSLEIEAYKKLGFLYLEELNDTANALETYLTFQQKYPDNKYRIESWYALYKIFSESGDAEQASYYKSLIVSNYPDSDYARVIMDPDYFIKLAQKKGQSAKLYERAYLAFENEQYYRVITYADRALEEYPNDTAVLPRFLYLRAISLGKVNVPDTLYAALDDLTKKYPTSAVTPRAKSVMSMLRNEYGIGNQNKVTTDSIPSKVVDSPFSFEAEATHMVAIVLNSGRIEIDPLKVRVSDFKDKYFRLLRIRIKSLMLDNLRAVLTVGNFEGSAAAQDFYTAIKNDDYVLSGLNPSDYQIFTISTANYPILYREKNVKAYMEFYEATYLDE